MKTTYLLAVCIFCTRITEKSLLKTLQICHRIIIRSLKFKSLNDGAASFVRNFSICKKTNLMYIFVALEKKSIKIIYFFTVVKPNTLYTISRRSEVTTALNHVIKYRNPYSMIFPDFVFSQYIIDAEEMFESSPIYRCNAMYPIQ